MKKIYLILLALLLAGCQNIQLVSPYDEVIDNGLKEYKESINTLAKNLADSGGTKEGMYKENVESYNALESKIDLLIDRATLQSTGNGCKLSKDIAARVKKIMKENMPTEAGKNKGDSYGCTVTLLDLVKKQLVTLQTIHREADKCKAIGIKQDNNGNPKQVSCLRPATSGTAMKLTNQSINAAWVVETAKKFKGED